MNKLIFFLLVCVPQLVLGQEVRFRFPAGAATWTVTCQKARQGNSQVVEPQAPPRPGEPARPPDLKKVEVFQSDTARKSVTLWSNGRTKELWSSPNSNAIVTEEPNGDTLVSTNTALYADPFDSSNLDWIKTATPTSDKPVQYQGVNCIHYTGSVNEGNVKLIQVVPCQAWINAETLLPVVIWKGDLLGKFAFGPPPDSPPIMPDRFKKRLDYYKLVMGLK